MNDKQLINFLWATTCAGLFGTFYYAQKAEEFRKKTIKAALAAQVSIDLLWEAKDLIGDPEKKAAFETKMEKQVEQTAAIQSII